MTPEPTDDDGVLAPDELQLTDDRVDALGENRYLVRPERMDRDDSSESAAAAAASSVIDADVDTETATDDASRPTRLESDQDQFDRARATDGLAAAPEPHGVDITLKTDGEIAHHYATSNDVREVFVDLLTWYADQLDDDVSPEEALQVMLAASDLEV
ncbi:DUF7500 family protein [Natronolimnohabitans innermongolicus]|uniref:Uncharacterized protein n=1 Tax=Natronolimnohabitans innermongolicus JCM 12255 TaxID=1227499 RepID=L9WXX8_9EURY|nr:hypothetical protein [Natronolimnohabitans innermongolicus]ELY53218.1 hypothetical protein C493_14348 [Natronolimnohabitans innermongolicus JCM 12255]